MRIRLKDLGIALGIAALLLAGPVAGALLGQVIPQEAMDCLAIPMYFILGFGFLYIGASGD